MKIKLSTGDEAEIRVAADTKDHAVERLKQIPEFIEFVGTSKVMSCDIFLEDEKPLKKNDYVLRKSNIKNNYVVTDVSNGVVVTFDIHKFNSTHSIKFLENSRLSAVETATILRRIGEWLYRYHYFIAMPIEKNHRHIVGKKIEELRKNAGLTQQELADKCGIDRTHIVKIENGRFNFTIDTLFLISKALGKDIEFV